MKFFIGIHEVNQASQFKQCMISVNRLKNRKASIAPNEWMLDSGAFTTVTKHGGYLPTTLPNYATQIVRWSQHGNLLAAVTQDYMCEPFVLTKTGMTVAEHQRLTIYRYKALRKIVPQNIYVMPVLQGYEPSEYVSHIRQYGDLLEIGMWVGVGSVCKRNSRVGLVEDVLQAIKLERPDLKLHGFGLKLTALRSHFVRSFLYSADSMAWCFAARYEGRKAHDINEALSYLKKVETCPIQLNLFA